MKGDVKRKFSSDDWSHTSSLAASPLGWYRPTCNSESGIRFFHRGARVEGVPERSPAMRVGRLPTKVLSEARA